jgi:phosphatidylinositol alpha 1,6-mannosyltransferase
MRIALVAESFFPAVDGTTTTVKAVLDRLVDTGHDVLVVAPAPGLTSYRGCRIARVQARDRVGAQVRAALASFGPDLVHVTSPGTVGRKALEHARRLGVRTVTVQQTPVPHLAAERWRTRVADRSDRVLVTATWMRERLADLDVEAALWRPGVDTAAFGPQLRDPWLHRHWARGGSGAGPLVVVGYVGSLHRRHGVRALADLAQVPGIRPVVVGDGPQRPWLRSRLPGAKLTGPLETGDLTRALASLDVLVHPGPEETCCHALREAAASGVPVVAPRSGGAPDVVRSLETGLLYDPTESRGLARAVAAVAGDRHRALLGARGRELALARDWREAVDELVGHHYAAPAGGAPVAPYAA